MTSPNIAAESANTARYGDLIDGALNNDYRASTDPGLSSRPRSRQPGRSALHPLPPGHLEPSRDAPPNARKSEQVVHDRFRLSSRLGARDRIGDEGVAS